MKRLILAAVAAGALPVLTLARPLTPDEALARALENAPMRQAASSSPFELTNTTRSDNNEACVYLFNGSESFLLVSGDDRTPAVLGYGDNPSEGAVPPAMQWWMSQYANQIAAAATDGAQPLHFAPAEHNPIEPMTVTRWNQSAPYNNLCPLDNGSRSVTGCVATAMSQVMYYHQWPPKGVGSNSYTTTTDGLSVSLDFADYTFDWAEMLPVYTSSATAAQNTAVAQLMFAAGVSVNMDYTSTESGASAMVIPAAMVNHFNYDKGIRYAPREFFGLYDWQDFVYNQLVNYGPVQYSGQSNDGGHSFVCDGYSSDGYFHINWGWGGMSDGYFLLTALDPGQQGIGGSTSGYNFDQSIVANVSKPVAGSEMYYNLLAEGFSISTASASAGSQVSVSGPVYNFSTGPVSGTVSVKITASDGTPTYASGAAFNSLATQNGFSAYSFVVPSGLADGVYTLTPAVKKPDGTWQDVPVAISAPQFVSMKMQSGTASFTTATAASVSAENMALNTPIYLGSKFNLTATLANNGTSEYYGTIAPGLVDASGNLVAMGDNYPTDLLAGESTDMDYIGAINRYANNTAPAAGTYTLYLVDSNTYRPVSAGQSVQVKAAPTSTSLSVSNFAVSGDAQAVDASNVEFTATVDCTEGYFGGTLTVAIFPVSTSSVSSVDALTSNTMFINAGSSANMEASGAFTAAEPGKQYMAAVFNGQSQISGLVYFTVAKTTAIDAQNVASLGKLTRQGTTTTVGGAAALALYTPSGTLIATAEGESIDCGSVSAGVYILRALLTDGSVIVYKLAY